MIKAGYHIFMKVKSNVALRVLSSGTLLQMGKDGEMELKDQFQGKVEYKEKFCMKPRKNTYRYRHKNSMQSILN